MTTLGDIQAAADRLRGVTHVTPVLTSTYFDKRTGNTLFFKCENFQRTGSFKIRGAYNALSQLSPEAKARGVLAYSSGNHAQGVALAARLLGISAKIVMPQDAPRAKVEATRNYGAEVIFYDRYTQSREAIGRALADQEGRTLIPPFDHPDVIAGQGTIAVELLREVPDLDIVLVPVGGGGLIAGNAVALKTLRPHIEVYGIEIEQGNDVYLSFKQNRRVEIAPFKTIADGIQTLAPGELTLPLIQKYVNDILLVTDDDIKAVLPHVLERMKIVIEPTAAVTLAALLKNERGWHGKRIGLIVCGGNVDSETLATLL